MLAFMTSCSFLMPDGNSGTTKPTPEHTHGDATGDSICDICGEYIEIECTSHVDVDENGRCDVCLSFIGFEKCDGHADADNNGRCDGCNATVVIVLDFYAVNDLHGKFADTDQSAGVDELTTYFKNAYESDDHAIILSSGDMWQGSSESNLTNGNIITDWMNELDFVSMTVGNHEYDWGAEYIIKNAEIAEFPILAINIYDRTTNKRVEYCESSVMIERDGVKIGIIGAVGDCYSSISAGMVEDVYFKTGSELTALVKAESNRLRAAGADLIVYSLHGGNGRSSSVPSIVSSSALSSYYDMTLSNGYVDIVFEAHTHQGYINIDGYGVYHLQGNGDGKAISHAELELNIITGSVSISEAEVVKTEDLSDLADDPIVAELMEKYNDKIADAMKPIGVNTIPRSEYYITELVSELYYKAGMEKWGQQYDIVLGGGYLKTRDPYNLKCGEITYGDLVTILPFDNDIVLCKISGRNLKNRFIESSNSDYHIYCGEYGNGLNIDPYATYYIVVDRYTLDYAPNGLTEVDVYKPNVYARDLLADYIRSGALEEEYSITDIGYILDLVGSLEYNVLTDRFFIKGEIVSTPSADYGNTTIRDENGNEIYIYGIQSGVGGKFDTISNPPKLGDTVILYGPAVYYSNNSTGEKTIEIKNAYLIDIVEE